MSPIALQPATYSPLNDYRTEIRLHSSAAYPKVTSEFFQPSQYARQRCHEAVGKIFELTDYVVNHEMIDKLGPPFAFTVWVAARMLVIQGLEFESINPHIVKLIRLLEQMGSYWDVARRYGQLIRRVYVEIQHKTGGGTPASFHILADLRRCAYDLMFSILKQPREDQGGDEMYSQATEDPLFYGPRPRDSRNEQTESHHLHNGPSIAASSQRDSRPFAVSMDPTGNGTARARDWWAQKRMSQGPLEDQRSR